MKNTYAETMATAFEDELRKIASAKLGGILPNNRSLALLGGGALGYEVLRRANQDRRTGRMMRIQQGY